jgi:DNA-binding NarL/FixJ family response regulator
MSIKVLIAENHPLVRAGIRALLNVCPGIEVVGEAADATSTAQQIERQKPDVVLLDVTLPPEGGLKVAARLIAQHPDLPVIILSMWASPVQVREAMESGATGFILKHLVNELEPAVRAVAAGSRYYSRALRYALPAEMTPAVVRESGTASLTPRQLEILKLIAQGNTTKEVARQLGISVKTAQTHRTQLMERLDIHDVAGLVRYAIRAGIVTPDK